MKSRIVPLLLAAMQCAAVTAVMITIATAAAAAAADNFPDKPIRLVVPFAAGGGGDSAGRVLAPPLSARLGRQVVIDNRAGAGGIVGMEIVKAAAPDGYTLLLSTTGFAAMPALYKKLSFDPVADFTAVITAHSGSYILVVHPSLPVKTVKELIAYARANPGKLDFASAGTGTTIHLAGELFNSMAGVKMVHVPYKGAAPGLVDVVAGQVQTMFSAMLNALPMIAQGRVRALGVTAAQRSALAPDLPTIAESGLPGFEVAGWYGLAAPARMPREVVNRINADTRAALREPAVVERLRGQGLEVVGDTPDEAAALVRRDVARWTRVVREAGMERQ